MTAILHGTKTFWLIFVHAEGILRQHNYLVNKSVSIEKGSNTVIGLLHYNLTNLVQGKNKFRYLLKILAGQNKKTYVLLYLL